MTRAPLRASEARAGSGPLSIAYLLMLLMPVRCASAHSFAPAVLVLQERAAGAFDVVWKAPPADAGVSGDADVVPQLPSRCTRVGARDSSDVEAGGPAYWRIDCGVTGLRAERIGVRGLDGSRAEVIVAITWRDGTTASAVLRSGADAFAVPPAAGVGLGVPAGAVLRSYSRLGVEHILLGADHLLFVLGLVLLVDTWAMLLKTISAFTLAHSLALALAVLGVIAVPAAPVEALIALSIVLVAVELTRSADAPRTLSRRYPWGVALGFGLVHGLGFAGALAQIGLPPDQIPLALLAFNLGVELGQLLFVLAMLVPLAALTRLAAQRPRLRLIPAYAIGTVASAWVFDRVYGFWRM